MKVSVGSFLGGVCLMSPGPITGKETGDLEEEGVGEGLSRERGSVDLRWFCCLLSPGPIADKEEDLEEEGVGEGQSRDRGSEDLHWFC